MGQVRVSVGGRSYPLACKDGEEDLLVGLAGRVNEKAEMLANQLGQVPETRLLLMSAIMLADELTELAGRTATSADVAADIPAPVPDADARAREAVDAAAARVNQIADLLEKQAATA
ncbi:cell division protein ZapA [Pacificimonas sp. WHA3]|uniref:Cell division protein ZapA n=1 Tax=Pacificimonas pallii TaxID=2827236 RepID=A0ABS6SE84_9SPHN|nr:cell division protein ZapA [Pacificimonas pallii]MBV7256656.1 cell division protein ZapA [Pacificimonas pallii]